MLRAWIVLVLVAAVGCDEPNRVAPTAPGSRAAAEELLRELGQIQRTLSRIRQEADQDVRIQEARGRLGELTQAAVVELDPRYEARRDRLEELTGALSAARQGDDRAAAESISREILTLAEEAQRFYRVASQRPEVVAQQAAIDRMLEEGMRAHDAEVDRLNARAVALQRAFTRNYVERRLSAR